MDGGGVTSEALQAAGAGAVSWNFNQPSNLFFQWASTSAADFTQDNTWQEIWEFRAEDETLNDSLTDATRRLRDSSYWLGFFADPTDAYNRLAQITSQSEFNAEQADPDGTRYYWGHPDHTNPDPIPATTGIQCITSWTRGTVTRSDDFVWDGPLAFRAYVDEAIAAIEEPEVLYDNRTGTAWTKPASTGAPDWSTTVDLPLERAVTTADDDKLITITGTFVQNGTTFGFGGSFDAWAFRTLAVADDTTGTALAAMINLNGPSTATTHNATITNAWQRPVQVYRNRDGDGNDVLRLFFMQSADTRELTSGRALVRIGPVLGGSSGGGGGGGDGLDQAQVDARVRVIVDDWAEAGNTSAIPAGKLTNAPGLTHSTGGLASSTRPRQATPTMADRKAPGPRPQRGTALGVPTLPLAGQPKPARPTNRSALRVAQAIDGRRRRHIRSSRRRNHPNPRNSRPRSLRHLRRGHRRRPHAVHHRGVAAGLHAVRPPQRRVEWGSHSGQRPVRVQRRRHDRRPKPVHHRLRPAHLHAARHLRWRRDYRTHGPHVHHPLKPRTRHQRTRPEHPHTHRPPLLHHARGCEQATEQEPTAQPKSPEPSSP